MKTKSTKSVKSQSTGLQVRPDEQLSKPDEQAKPRHILPYVNFAEREANRALSTEQVLDTLRKWMPEQYALAEVIGKWVWVTFPEPPTEQVRGQLSQFGFHWNNARKCWQHPCGQFATERSGQDPRLRYGSHFAADHRAAA